MINQRLAVAAAFALLAVSPLASATCLSPVWSTQQTQQSAVGIIQLMETIDYDGDGVLDLVGAISPGGTGSTNTLYSWRGVGDGTFQTPVSLGTADLSDLAVADVNNDGRQDLIMTTWHATLVTRLGTGSGFGPEITKSLNHTENRLTAVRFDGDSYIDLVATSPSLGIFVRYHGEGNGNFTEVQRLGTPLFPTDVVAADFDGDSRMDIAYGVHDTKAVNVAFQNFGGTFTTVTMTDVDWPSALVVGDFDEDGKPDLAAATYAESFAINPAVIVFRNLGSRTFGRATLLPAIPHLLGSYYALRAADVNGDGHLDLVTGSVNSPLVLTYIGNGDGTFRSPSYYTSPDNGGFGLAAGDFDGDSDLDLALGNYGKMFTARNDCGSQVYLATLSRLITAGDTAPLRAVVSGIASRRCTATTRWMSTARPPRAGSRRTTSR